MRKIDEINVEPSCRCTGHRDQFSPAAHHSQAMSPNTKALRFTPDMIRDQEMLVSSMSQQGISEDLIRRQYERLLEEQSKQLRFMKDESATNKADPENLAESKKCDPRVEANAEPYKIASDGSFVAASYNQPAANQFDNKGEACKDSPYQDTANQQLPPPDTEEQSGRTHPTSNTSENDSPVRTEPSSLLKLRLKKEVLNSQKRNNGLQEAATAFKIIKDSKSKIAQDRLSAEMEGLIKLNGTQERTAGEQTQFNQTEGSTRYSRTENQGKLASANGLENSRNLDNPLFRRYHPPAAYTATSSSMPQPQSQKALTNGEYYSHPSSAATAATAHLESSSQQINDTCNQQNSLYSDLQEPKVIGGFTYFARKQHCIPKISGFSSDRSNHQMSSQLNTTTSLPISH